MDSACIFEFCSRPSRGFVGQPGGRSVSVYANGDVFVRSFVIGEKDPVRERLAAASPALAETVQSILERHADAIAALPEHLDTGVCDGNMQFFSFGGKRVGGVMITRKDPEEVRRRNPRYYERCGAMIACTNTMLDIYNEIAAAVNACGAGQLLWIM